MGSPPALLHGLARHAHGSPNHRVCDQEKPCEQRAHRTFTAVSTELANFCPRMTRR